MVLWGKIVVWYLFVLSFSILLFCPWQEKVQRPKGHYWCDLSDSGLSKADLLNITDCSTSHLGREVRFWVWGVGDFLLMLIDVVQVLHLEKTTWLDWFRYLFCMPERKNKYRCYRCIYLCTKLAAVLPCMLKDRDEESFWKTGSSPTRDILSLVTSSEPWFFPPPSRRFPVFLFL